MKPLAGKFVTSVSEGGVVPTEGLPVVALVGRSNVGKSSLINTLVRKRIARSGGKPGTTRLINLYRIATPSSNVHPFLLVDLPGYGYARGGTKARESFQALTDSFFRQATVGIPGPATLKTLISYAKSCGIGNSLRFLSKQAFNITKLASTKSPDKLLFDLANYKISNNHTQLAKLHFYAFGGIKKTSNWLNSLKSNEFIYNSNNGFQILEN